MTITRVREKLEKNEAQIVLTLYRVSQGIEKLSRKVGEDESYMKWVHIKQ